MSKLTTSDRKSLPKQDFAGPGRSYPINDAEHGRKAIQLGARSEKAGNLSPAEYAKIKARVKAKYPGIDKKESVYGS